MLRSPEKADPMIVIGLGLQFLVELRGFEPLTPSVRTPGAEVVRGRWGRSLFGGSLSESLGAAGVAVLLCCTSALGLPSRRPVTPDRSGIGSACWKATVYRFVATEAGVEHTFAAGQSG